MCQHGWEGAGSLRQRQANHIQGRAQEHIVTVGCQVDARVALLECVFVALTLDEGRQRPPHNTSRSHHGAKTRDTGIPSEVPRTSWDVMDEVNLEEVFFVPNTNVEKLATVCALLFGKDAKLVGDTVAEERAWKVFGLLPAMLLHRPRGCGRVGKGL